MDLFLCLGEMTMPFYRRSPSCMRQCYLLVHFVICLLLKQHRFFVTEHRFHAELKNVLNSNWRESDSVSSLLVDKTSGFSI